MRNSKLHWKFFCNYATHFWEKSILGFSCFCQASDQRLQKESCFFSLFTFCPWSLNRLAFVSIQSYVAETRVFNRFAVERKSETPKPRCRQRTRTKHWLTRHVLDNTSKLNYAIRDGKKLPNRIETARALLVRTHVNYILMPDNVCWTCVRLLVKGQGPDLQE